MHRLICFFLLLITTLTAGDKWDYYIRTQSDITWIERNQLFLDKFVPENVIKKNIGLISYLHSSPTISPLQSSKYCYSFLSHLQLTPDEAKALVQKIHNDLLIEIHRNRDTLIYITKDTDAKHLPASYIGVKISFFTPKKERIVEPHVARVFKVGNKAYYNFADTAADALKASIALN